MVKKLISNKRRAVAAALAFILVLAAGWMIGQGAGIVLVVGLLLPVVAIIIGIVATARALRSGGAKRTLAAAVVILLILGAAWALGRQVGLVVSLLGLAAVVSRLDAWRALRQGGIKGKVAAALAVILVITLLWLLTWSVGIFLALVIALVMVTTPDSWRAFVEGIRRSLAEALGPRPGAYWMIVLWGAVIFSAIRGVLALSQMATTAINGSVPPPDFILPIGVVAAALHWVVTRPNSLSRQRRAAVLGGAAALALATYGLSSAVSNLAGLLGAEIPDDVSKLISPLWSSVAWFLLFTLTISRRRPLPALWRLIFVGMVGGALAAIALAYPVYTWAFPAFVPGFAFSGAAHERLALAGSVIGILLALAVGPAAVFWIRPAGWPRRLALGAAAGALAGFVLFGALGAPVAGLISGTPLYGVALSRQGFAVDEWTLKLGISVNLVLPLVSAAFGLLMGGGALLGGLTAALTPVRSTAERTTISWPLAALIATIPLGSAVIVPVVILGLLGPAIRHIFDTYGYTPVWQPEWMLPLVAGQAWLLLTIAQVVGLRWLHRPEAGEPGRQLVSLAYLNGVVMLLSSLFLVVALLGDPVVLVPVLVTAALSMETLAAARRLSKVSGSSGSPNRTEWAAAGAAAGLLYAIGGLLLISGALDLVLIQVVLIADSANTTAPPPGLDWLHRSLQNLFTVHSWALVWLTIGSISFGWFVALLLANWPWGWVQVLWQRIRTLAPRMSIPSVLKPLPWPLAGLAFALTLAGFYVFGLGLTLPISGLVFGLVFVVAAVEAYRGLMKYTPERARTRTRLTAFIGIALLAGLLAYLRQDEVVTQGGVSRYDGQRWEVFDNQNSKLGHVMNYHFFEDRQGNMWFAVGDGTVVEHSGDSWSLVQLSVSAFPSEPVSYDLDLHKRDSAALVEDAQGQMWISAQSTFGSFEAAAGGLARGPVTPGRLKTEAELAATPATTDSYYNPSSCVGAARLWDGDGNVVATLTGLPGAVSAVSFSPDASRLVTLVGGAAWLWDGNGHLIAILKSPARGITMVSFSPDSSRLVTGSDDTTAQLWDAATGIQLAVLRGHKSPLQTVAFSQDGARILTTANGYGDVETRQWDVNGNPLTPADSADMTAFDPNEGRSLGIGSGGEVQLTDANGNVLATVNTTASFSGAAFGGSRIVTESRDGSVQMWDLDGHLVASLNADVNFDATLVAPHNYYSSTISAPWLAVSPDGQRTLMGLQVRPDQAICLTMTSPVTGMTLDGRGDLWLATAGSGVIRFEGGRLPGDSRWDTLTSGTPLASATSGLASDNVHGVIMDQSGALWFATDAGLSRYDGANWQTTTIPGASAIEAVFEDSQGHLWAGADNGVFRYDGQTWANVLPDAQVTAFAEYPSGSLWVGTQNGLIRYDLQTGAQDQFNADNSGLTTNWVRDLHAGSDHHLWVSTFTRTSTPRPQILGILLSADYFLLLFGRTLLNYRRAPEAQARRLGRDIAADPGSLYPQAYALLAGNAEDRETFAELSRSLRRGGDSAGARTTAALAALAAVEPLTPDDIERALDETAAAFEADSGRAWALGLFHLHKLLREALSGRRSADITGLELTVNPGTTVGGLALSSRHFSVETLPPFAPGGAEVWRALEQIGAALRKFEAVDDPADRLSYLAEALSAAEVAQLRASQAGPPEGQALAAVAERWRHVIGEEINLVSGRADLRLELRTRQTRRSDAVTVALRLQNVGRAAAEHITVRLLAEGEFDPVSALEVRLDRLAAERAAPVEFTLRPTGGESLRLIWRIAWDDRISGGNSTEFADVVRFYEEAGEFQAIPNPYIVGHPVRSASMFYGREDIFRFVAENLSGTVQDRTLVLYGQRRTGKTSILYQLLAGRLGEGFIPALVDMQELAPLMESTGDFLGEVAERMARAASKAGLAVEAPPVEAFMTAPTRVFNHFLDALEGSLTGRRLVVMLDEFELIESKIADGKLDADLLGYFRSLIQHRSGLVFIFTGTHRLQEMSRQYWSILFNIALYRRVSLLSEKDAVDLIRKPVAGKLDIDDLAVEKMIQLTAGHPYFLQLMSWALVNHCNARQRNYATINDVNTAVQDILTTGEAHFAYIWQQADDDERLALAALAHTVRPGKNRVRPAEILETLAAAGDSRTIESALIAALDRLAAQEVLATASEALHYGFQLEVLRLWVEANKSVAALVERRR